MEIERIKQKTLDSLPEYSCSLPTGTTIGKVWKRNNNFGSDLDPEWIICEYVNHSDPNLIGIDYRVPVIID